MTKIEDSIKAGKEFTELSVFELRVNGLDYVVVFDDLYIYQVFDKKYL